MSPIQLLEVSPMWRFACLTLTLAIAVSAAVAQPQKKMRAVLPEDCTLQLQDGNILFTELEIDNGCTISFVSSVKDANVVVQKLTLHGKSTIDLSAPVVSFPVPAKPGTPQQARNDPPTQRGQNGTHGGNGTAGLSGTNLKLTVETLDASDGSLWIRTDGSPAGNGGPGGDGAKGSAGPFTGAHCYDGGAGGDGGVGGNGGAGGDTTRVVLIVGPKTVASNRTPGLSPSARPADADIPGAIVAAGSPGAGGGPGPGGNGGPGGEGRSCHFPATDAHGGSNGHTGPAGSPGPIGNFVP